MTATDPRRTSHVRAVATALEPYQWRSFRPELLARAVLAANDRQRLRRVLIGVPGAVVGTWDPLEPVDRDDARVPVLVEFLAAHRWTELSLSTVCRELIALIDDAPG